MVWEIEMQRRIAKQSFPGTKTHKILLFLRRSYFLNPLPPSISPSWRCFLHSMSLSFIFWFTFWLLRKLFFVCLSQSGKLFDNFFRFLFQSRYKMSFWKKRFVFKRANNYSNALIRLVGLHRSKLQMKVVVRPDVYYALIQVRLGWILADFRSNIL